MDGTKNSSVIAELTNCICIYILCILRYIYYKLVEHAEVFHSFKTQHGLLYIDCVITNYPLIFENDLDCNNIQWVSWII